MELRLVAQIVVWFLSPQFPGAVFVFTLCKSDIQGTNDILRHSVADIYIYHDHQSVHRLLL